MKLKYVPAVDGSLSFKLRDFDDWSSEMLATVKDSTLEYNVEKGDRGGAYREFVRRWNLKYKNIK